MSLFKRGATAMVLFAALTFLISLPFGCSGEKNVSRESPAIEPRRIAVFEGAEGESEQSFDVGSKNWSIQATWSYDGTGGVMPDSAITVSVSDGQGNQFYSQNVETENATGINAENAPDYRVFPDIPDASFDNGPGTFLLEVSCRRGARWLVTLWETGDSS